MPDDQPYYGSWFLRMDRFGDAHAVCAQNKEKSCIMASIKMVAFKVNKLRPGRNALHTEHRIEQQFHYFVNQVGNLQEPDIGPHVATQVLNSLGCGNWAYEWPQANDIPAMVMKYVGVDRAGLGITGVNAALRKFPVILFCEWAGNDNEGHAIVCDTVTHVPMVGTYATICDPWDANVHFEKIQKGHPFTYSPNQPIGVNFWGKVKGVSSRTGTISAIAYCQKSPGFWN